MSTELWARLRETMEKNELSIEFAFLERLADDEAAALRTIGGIWKKKADAARDARKFIAADVTERLLRNAPLSPNAVLRHRRQHYCWAVACMIRTAQGRPAEGE